MSVPVLPQSPPRDGSSANATLPAVLDAGLRGGLDADGLAAADIAIADGKHRAIAAARPAAAAGARSTSRAAWSGRAFVDMPHPYRQGPYLAAQAQSRRHLHRRARSGAPTARPLVGRGRRAAHGFRPALRLCPRHRAVPHPHRFGAAAAQDLLAGVRRMRERWPGRSSSRRVRCSPSTRSSTRLGSASWSRGCRGHGGVLGAVTYMVPDLDDAARPDVPRWRPSMASTSISMSTRPTTRCALAAPHRRGGAAHRFPGKIIVGHCCSLALQPDDEAEAPWTRVREAGHRRRLAADVQSLSPGPRTPARTPRWRGVTLLHEMKARGIPVAVASDNTRDPFYAYGDLDMLEVFREAARILHLDHPFADWPPRSRRRPADDHGLAPSRHDRRRRGRPTSSSSRPQLDGVRRPSAIGPRRCCATAGAIDRALPDYPRAGRSDGDAATMTDDSTRLKSDARRPQDRGQSGDREAEEPRLLSGTRRCSSASSTMSPPTSSSRRRARPRSSACWRPATSSACR